MILVYPSEPLKPDLGRQNNRGVFAIVQTRKADGLADGPLGSAVTYAG
jgi:hypothetical protein